MSNNQGNPSPCYEPGCRVMSTNLFPGVPGNLCDKHVKTRMVVYRKEQDARRKIEDARQARKDANNDAKAEATERAEEEMDAAEFPFASERIEKQITGKGPPLWRCVAYITQDDGTVKEFSTEWKERQLFWMDYSILRKKTMGFVFEGVGRLPNFIVPT